MTVERATYMDTSAIVKLAVREPESTALRRYLRRKRPLVTSALARTEVARALLPLGPDAVVRGEEVLRRIDIVRINDQILRAAGSMLPLELRSLDAIPLPSRSYARTLRLSESAIYSVRPLGESAIPLGRVFHLAIASSSPLGVT